MLPASLNDQPHAADDGDDPREAALATLVHACERQEPMSSEELRAWQKRMGLSGRAAARLLGMNTTTYLDRANGKSHTTGLPVPVPRTLTLACAALEAARMLKLAHSDKAGL